MNRRMLSLLSLMLMLPCIAFAQDTWDGTTATSFAGGSGTESDPYLISSCEEWSYFCKQESYTGKFYKLECSLSFPQDGEDSPSASPFDGTFDGNGYSIINNCSNSNLFRDLAGTVKNLYFSTTGQKTGGKYGDPWLSGKIANTIKANGVIDNCYINSGGNVLAPNAPCIFNTLEDGAIVSNCNIIGNPSTDANGGPRLYYYIYGSAKFVNCHSTFKGTPTNWSDGTSSLYVTCDGNVISYTDWVKAIRGNSDFTVTFHDVAGYIQETSQTYSETTTITLPTPTSSCTFVGWYLNGKKVTTSTLSVSSDTDLYAYWSRGVTSQPTSDNPTYAIEDAEHATFQWYKLSGESLDFPTWTSTNKADNSSSSYTYSVSALAGQVLYIEWSVSSENACDYLYITVNGKNILRESGECSGTCQYTFPSDGDYSVIVSYKKDDDASDGSDQAKVTRCYLGGTPEALSEATNATLCIDNLTSSGYYFCIATYTNSFENISSEASYLSDKIKITVPEYLASGTCGDNLTWVLDEDYTLTISGTGAMTDYNLSSVPWWSYETNIKSVIIESGVTSIGEQAFSYCYALSNITIPSSVTSIGYSAFTGCSSLSDITIPEGVTSIGYSAFYGCTKLSSITIPSSVTSIRPHAFLNCSGLPVVDGIRYADTYLVEAVDKSISNCNIKKGTRYVGEAAFCGCTKLSMVVIPESVEFIGGRAFDELNYSLKKIICLAPNPPSLDPQESWDEMAEEDNLSFKIYVTKSSCDLYKQPDYWKLLNIVGNENGDVNCSESINITDAVEIVNSVLGTPSANFVKEWSDVNGDNQYTIADASAVINVILGEEIGTAEAKSRANNTTPDELTIKRTEANRLTMCLDNKVGYNAFQFDVVLPEGMTLENVLLYQSRCADYSVMFRETSAGHYTVAAFNFDNSAFATGSGSLLNIITSGNGNDDEITISNIHFATTKATDVQFGDLTVTEATDIIDINTANGTNSNSNIYDRTGRKLQNAKSGVNIINGKKVIIKYLNSAAFLLIFFIIP